MKKIIILITLVFSIFIFSQEFKLTEDNFKVSDDTSKNYIVLSFPGVNKQTLFDKTKNYITSNYPYLDKEKLKETVNDQLLFEVVSQTSRTVFINKRGSNVWSVVNYFEINFKDDKIMIKPTFVNLTNADKTSTTLLGSFFNSRGIVRLENAANFVEAFTNSFVNNIKNEVSSNKTNDW
ncbi:hypothetical protein [Chryseobacterium turcicum]|uniref:DUF4468 domain-containing protein n=1 Tax=Chryseobacterium turcicum TaxID=2898076 RepID=A0A9Q3V535_9FLAO|nr:hypothetical protein [Chryseobacterium turcicum]MCD1117244.1 hypothetical protein [Chryseobacterium turcicum]